MIRHDNSSNGHCLCVFFLVLITFLLPGIFLYAHRKAIPHKLAESLEISEAEIDTEFESFMQEYQKAYPSQEDFLYRRQVFAENYRAIQRYNFNESSTAVLGVNKFADLTQEEYEKIYLTEKTMPEELYQKEPESSQGSAEETTSEPVNIDWEADGLLAPVKDQGNCGSCWTFGSISVVESRYAKVNKIPVIPFSEQQLVDCCNKRSGFNESNGCNGGIVEDALPYMKIHGIVTLKDYPYTAYDDQCKESEIKQRYFPVDDLVVITPLDTPEMLKQLKNHTMYVSVNAGAFVFRFYKSGIITTGCSHETLGHGVTLVGAGTSKDGIDFWKIRNSWGANWGDRGYVYFKRDSSEKGPGVCGVARHAVYPKYKEAV